MEKYIKIEEIKESNYNPREISEKDYNNLKNNIKRYGFLGGLVINKYPGRENILISGHQRLKIAKELGMKEVPVYEVNLPETEEQALNLHLNKTGGVFVEDKLIEVLLSIDENNEDLLKLTGFSPEEIIYLLGLKEKEKSFATSLEDQFSAENRHGIKEGDIVKLDRHYIICGDSSKTETWNKLIGNEKMDLIITSPPYNLNIKYGKYSDNKEYKEYMDMIKKVFEISSVYLNKGRFLCINIGREWGPINIPAKYDNLMESLGYIFFRNIYWKKPVGAARGTMTSRNPFPRYYIPKVQTEIIEIYTNEETPDFLDMMLTYKYGETAKVRKEKIPDILLDKYAGNVWDMMTETQLSQEHPAPFPIQLPFNCIRFFTFENEKIIDPFAGSFTTMLATEQLNRIFYGMEIDPNYISLGIDRYMNMFPNAKLEIIKS